MANSKDIELAIKARDLASKPLAEIGAAVDKLVSAVADLSPAAAKGEKNLSEMTSVAGQLQKTLSALKSNSGVIESFQLLSDKVEQANEQLKQLQAASDSAKLALSNAATPTKDLQKAMDSAASAVTRQEVALVKYQAALEKLQTRAQSAGIDLTDLAKAQGQIDTAFAAAVPAYDAINNAIASYSANQRKAATEAKIAAEAAATQAATEKKLAQAQAEAAAATDSAAKKQAATMDAEAAAFKKAVFAAEAARAKDVELAFAEQEAATATLKKVAAQEAAEATAAALAAKTQMEAKAAQEAAAMEERFTATLRQQGEAAEGAAKGHGSLLNSFSLFRDEGRTTLSLYQRIRGELLSMTAAFVGFYGAIETVKSGFESLESIEGATSLLKSTFGDDAGKQLEYVRAQADRLGLSYVGLAKDYAKFSAAAANGGQTTAQTQAIFETFAEAAKVKKLDAEQTASIFGALDKIFAKDAVGATELFRKLSTDLPDAAAAFRKSIGTADGQELNEDQFTRLLKSGKITSEFLISFAAQYRKTFAEQLPEATNDTGAALARFSSSWDQFKIDILNGGALDAFKESLAQLTVYFKSDDGKRFASELAEGAKDAAQGLGLIVEHIEDIKSAILVLGVLWAANIGGSFIKDLMRLGTAIDGVSMELNAAMAAAPALSQALAATAAASVAGFAGFKIGTWLNDNIAGVRQFGVLLVGYYVELFNSIKILGNAAWDSIFGADNFETIGRRVKLQFQKITDDLKDQYHEAGKDPKSPIPVPGDSGAAGASGTAQTPEQLAAATKAALAAQDAELSDAAKSISTRLSEMRGELLKKDATDLKGYLAGLAESFAPLYAQIDKLKTDFPHNSQAMVDKLTAQLNGIKALSLADAGDKFNEDKAKRDLNDINTLLRERNALIQNETRKQANGTESRQTATTNIAGINASANSDILQKVTQLQGFLNALPANVQTKLKETSNELKIILDELTERPASNVLKDVEEQEEAINKQLQLRNTQLAAIKQQETAGLITTQQAKEDNVAINVQRDATIEKAKELITYIQTSNDLTDDQRKSLELVVANLQIAVASQKQFTDALYPAKQVAQDIASGLTGVAAAFAKSVVQTHNLGSGIKAAGQAFLSFASSFLLKMGEMIAQQSILNALGYGGGAGGAGGAGGGSGGGGIAKGISGFVSSLFGGGAAADSTAVTFDTSSASAFGDGLEGAFAASAFHRGGRVSAGAGVPRGVLSASTIAAARRYHNGGPVAGIKPGEVPAILQAGEEVLSRSNPRNVANGGGTHQPQHIQVINAVDHESIVRQGLQAPSNTKVILNLFRANKNAIKSVLN